MRRIAGTQRDDAQKAGALRRNGAPSSDQATMTTRFLLHGDLMTVLTTIQDPIYLSEPEVLSKTFQRDTAAAPMSPVGPPCVAAYEASATKCRTICLGRIHRSAS
ncbi:MAG: hypothetical protein ABJA98_00270 [Acidobacteriota bacterium]